MKPPKRYWDYVAKCYHKWDLVPDVYAEDMFRCRKCGLLHIVMADTKTPEPSCYVVVGSRLADAFAQEPARTIVNDALKRLGRDG
jgi:hypothetical protein